MSNIYYIYRHIRLDTNTPFYIGKGSNNRANLKKGKKMLGGGNPAAREVIDIETGIIYSSIKEAAEQFGLNVNTLRGYLNGHRPNKTSLKYKEEIQ